VYTDEMRRAFHSLDGLAPKGFKVDLIDNDNFLTIRIDEKSIFNLSHDDKIAAVRYVAVLKDALEQNGAIVLVVRKPLEQ
jgi:hypothetical protein